LSRGVGKFSCVEHRVRFFRGNRPAKLKTMSVSCGAKAVKKKKTKKEGKFKVFLTSSLRERVKPCVHPLT